MIEEKEKKEEITREQKPTFTIADKRFWARKEKEEAGDSGVQKPQYPTFVEELKAKLEQNEKKLKEYIILYDRLKSESDSFKKRLQKEQERKLDAERDKFLQKFLSVIDNLDRALKSTEDRADFDGLLAGIKLVREGFFKCLRDEGIEKIETVGKQFDPNTSEAVEIINCGDSGQNDMALEEIEVGYSRDGKLLRPAKVKVGKFTAKSS